MFQSLKEISNQKKYKILGICLGMQLLFNSSTEEGTTKGLGILNGKVEKFSFFVRTNNSFDNRALTP